MNLAPESSDEFFADDDRPLVIAITLTGEFFAKLVDYPIVVMGLDKQPLRGRVRRSYHEQFTESERATVSRWNTKFRRWYFVSGTPQRIMIHPKTLDLLRKAVAFFAGV